MVSFDDSVKLLLWKPPASEELLERAGWSKKGWVSLLVLPPSLCVFIAGEMKGCCLLSVAYKVPLEGMVRFS